MAAADDDAFGEIAEDGEAEGREQDRRVAARGCAAARGMRASPPCSRRRPRGRRQRRQRDVAGQRCRDQHEEQQEHRMQDAGDGTARAGAHVGGGACDRAGDADAAEERRRRCWRRPAPPARSSSGGGGRSCRRRPRPTAGIRSRRAARRRARRAARPGSLSSERSGRCGAGKRGGDAAEARADGLDRQAKAQAASGRHRDGDQHARPMRPHIVVGRRSARSTSRRALRPSGLIVPQACPRAASLGMIAPGSSPASVRPNRSWIWLAKMMTAMPAVKPTVTG